MADNSQTTDPAGWRSAPLRPHRLPILPMLIKQLLRRGLSLSIAILVAFPSPFARAILCCEPPEIRPEGEVRAWSGTGDHRQRRTDIFNAVLNDALMLAWTTPSAKWGHLADRFAAPSNHFGCRPEGTWRDLWRTDCIVVALLRSHAESEEAFFKTASAWGRLGVLVAAVVSLAEADKVERLLATVGPVTRAWLLSMLARIHWLSEALQSENPFIVLARWAAVDARGEAQLTDDQLKGFREYRGCGARISPFVTIGRSLRWRAERLLVDAYRIEYRKLERGHSPDCLALSALAEMAAEPFPNDLAQLRYPEMHLPACTANHLIPGREPLNRSVWNGSQEAFAARVVVSLADSSLSRLRPPASHGLVHDLDFSPIREDTGPKFDEATERERILIELAEEEMLRHREVFRKTRPPAIVARPWPLAWP